MHQCKHNDARCCLSSPAVGEQYSAHGCGRKRPVERALGHIDHHGDGDHRFVGRESQNEGQQDHAVHTEKFSDWIDHVRQIPQQGDISDGKISQKPENQTGGHGNGGGPPKDEYRPVKERADKDLSELRLSVRRQLQNIRGRLPAQNRGG